MVAACCEDVLAADAEAADTVADVAACCALVAACCADVSASLASDAD